MEKNDIDIILDLEEEGRELVIEDYDMWERVKDLCYDLSRSQGFYGRRYRDMCQFEDYYDGELPFPIVMQEPKAQAFFSLSRFYLTSQ